MAASGEGLYALYDFARSGIPFSTLLDTNVDAITAWSFGGLRYPLDARIVSYELMLGGTITIDATVKTSEKVDQLALRKDADGKEKITRVPATLLRVETAKDRGQAGVGIGHAPADHAMP